MDMDKVEIIAKRERDAILLYLWEKHHNEKERSDYILEILVMLYELGFKDGKRQKCQ